MTAIPQRRPARRGLARTLVPLALAAAISMIGSPLATTAADWPPQLGIGDPDLPEIRAVTEVAQGVTLTRIDRGLPLSDPDQIPTSQTGPWVVNVLTIDPKVARGQLVPTDGQTIAQSETVQELARQSGAIAAVNSSFFTYTGDREYPGDAGGLAIRGGRVISEPSPTRAREVDLILDSRTNAMKITKTSWRGQLTMESGTKLRIEGLNRRPKVPTSCADLVDQTTCAADGDTIRFHDNFSATTPSGPGVEVVFDAKGCIVSTTGTRGVALEPGQSSLQATGSDAKALVALGEAGGCGHWRDRVFDEDGRAIALNAHTWAVTGRVTLLEDGKSVVPADEEIPEADKEFFGRHPRTFVGQTADGRWMLVVVDGRSTTSVGTSLAESAQISLDLGMVDAINLDGGGSTAMIVNGALVNRPQGGTTQRKVGDALVWIPA